MFAKILKLRNVFGHKTLKLRADEEDKEILATLSMDSNTKYGGDALIGLDETVELHSFLEEYLIAIGEIEVEELPDSLAEVELCGCIESEPINVVEFETDISRKFRLTDYRDGSAYMVIAEKGRFADEIHSRLPKETVKEIIAVIKSMKEGERANTVIETGIDRRISFEDTFRTGFHIDVKEQKVCGKVVFANVFGEYAERFFDFFLRIDEEVFEPERRAAKVEELKKEREAALGRIYEIDSEILSLRR